MATTRTSLSLSSALPKPKYTGEDEELPAHAQPKGPRIVGAREVESQALTVKRSGPPSYGQRTGWRPRSQEDYGDGGAFPEIPIAQYPLDMGKKQASSSNAMALKVDGEGKVKYDAIARRGHSDDRIIHTSFKDLIPLRQQADAGELDLSRPSEEQVAETKRRTELALATLVSGAVAAQKPKNVKGISRKDPTYVRYTPAAQVGDNSRKQDRIMKIVEQQQDPMEPPKFKHKKIPRGPPSPPPPVMHSPPRKLTAEDQEAWRIPPPVSNWKNPKGYTIALDKRLAADGRGLQDTTINDKFASFTEALYTADKHAREEVKQRAMMQQRLAEKEKQAKEDNLRLLAQKAREERAATNRRPSRSRSRSASYSSRSRSRSRTPDSESDGERDRKERERQRADRRRENQREMRQKNMGHERRIQMMAREQNRDISEKVALGLAKPTQSKESMYDSRLFNQSSGFAAGFNEDQAYDKPLFADRAALSSIYRPSVEDEGEDGGETLDAIQGAKRFEGLGRAPKEGFKGAADAEKREGPVMFERDDGTVAGGSGKGKGKEEDPFGIGKMIDEVRGEKRYGLDTGEDREREGKRQRRDDSD
ncbi:putative transcriptional regulator Cwf13/SkiP [Elsinoe ampelina]|uniref:Pre-mRNA-processing protein 45 n=1 Tax=Elsinoe ampelina TaxID=302913 RepID=A0A6A6G4H9_9PEZI|nr:putative transcriptional regulator Cwf13/SkiP [Elsinoe ampelina]